MTSHTTPAHHLAVLFEAPRHYLVAHAQDVAFVRWQAKGDGAAVKRVHELLRPVILDHPRGVSFIHVLYDGAGLPDVGARQALTQMMDEFSDSTACVGVLLLGNGFWASAMQSALTGFRLLAPPRRWQMRFAASSTDLAGWVAKLHGQRTQRTIEPAEIARLTDQLIAAP